MWRIIPVPVRNPSFALCIQTHTLFFFFLFYFISQSTSVLFILFISKIFLRSSGIKCRHVVNIIIFQETVQCTSSMAYSMFICEKKTAFYVIFIPWIHDSMEKGTNKWKLSQSVKRNLYFMIISLRIFFFLLFLKSMNSIIFSNRMENSHRK